MNKFNQLSREDMKQVMGGSIMPESINPNCGDTNPVGNYVCCTWTSIINIPGETDCDTASLECANAGGHGITTDPSRC